jgi:hypothetical protein
MDDIDTILEELRPSQARYRISLDNSPYCPMREWFLFYVLMSCLILRRGIRRYQKN